MFVHPDKNIIIQTKNKYNYFDLNTYKTPTSTKNINKNQIIKKTSINNKNNKNTPLRINIFNETQNKKQILINKITNNISKLKNYYTSKNTIENELRKKSFKIKDIKKKLYEKNYFTNFYDINNNNYFVNLFNTSTSIPSKLNTSVSILSKYKGRNSVINKNYYTRVNSRNINNKEMNLNKINKTNNYESSTNGIDTFNDSAYFDTKEMLKNYRNKLLKEFLKYLKKFYINYYKKYFIIFINKLKSIKNKKSLKQYVYSKKIQKQPFNKSKKFKKNSLINSLINRKMIINKKLLINKKIIGKSFCLTDRRLEGNSIVSKIINNKSNKLLDGKIRNIFLDSSFLNKENTFDDISINNNTSNNDRYSSIDNNHSFRGFKNRILLGEIISPKNKTNNNTNSREIKIDFRQLEKKKQEKNKYYLSFDNKIQLRFNEIESHVNKNKNIRYTNLKFNENFLIISNLVESFTIISKKDIQRMNELDRRIKYYNLLRNQKFLSSIKEEDEKFSLSIQDSIPAESTKLLVKESIYNSHFKQNKMNFKIIINNFCKEKYKKIFINKIKGIADVYKMNKDIK